MNRLTLQRKIKFNKKLSFVNFFSFDVSDLPKFDYFCININYLLWLNI